MTRLSYLDLPGGPLHFADFGGEGDLLLGVHGLGGAWTNWMATAPHLTPHLQVRAVDLPGFGLSPPHGPHTVATLVGALTETLERWGPAILAGNSMGGLVAQLVAARRGDLVRGLVLISPAVPPPTDPAQLDIAVATRLVVQSLPGLGPGLLAYHLRRASPQELVNRTLRIVAAEPGRVAPQVLETAVKMAAARRQLPWAVQALSQSGRSVGAVLARRRRYLEAVRSITAPTLLLWGDQDRVVSPAGLRRLAELRPDWKAVVLPGVGHVPQLETPLTVAREIVSWWGERPGPRAGDVPKGRADGR